MKKKQPYYNVIAVGSPVKVSLPIMRDYKRKLQDLTNQMVKEFYIKIPKAYNGYLENVAMDSDRDLIDDKMIELIKKYRGLFEENAKKYAFDMFIRQLKYARSKTYSNLKTMFMANKEGQLANFKFKGSVITKSLRPILQSSISENVRLITSIPEQYFDKVSGAVERSMQFGGSLKGLQTEIKKYGQTTFKRAGLIAEDQTRKAYESIQLNEFKEAGIDKVQWIHSGSGDTFREYHAIKWDGVSGIKDGKPNGLNGFIFNRENPPVIQKAQKNQPEIRGYPAQLPFCKCFLIPILAVENLA